MAARGLLAVLAIAALAMPAVAQQGERVPEPVASPADSPSFEDIHTAYLADGELQLERPGLQPLEPRTQSEMPAWLGAIGRFIADVIVFIAPLLKWILIIGVVALVVWLLWFLFGDILRTRFGREKAARDDVVRSHAEDLRPDAQTARTLLEEADELARQGRFAEAVHLLLFRSIEDIQTRRKRVVPRSMTAREIGTLSDLPDRARQALSPIIAIVERSFFGGRDVDSAGWRDARASYEHFAFGDA